MFSNTPRSFIEIIVWKYLIPRVFTMLDRTHECKGYRL
jgi:hypothetical protein